MYESSFWNDAIAPCNWIKFHQPGLTSCKPQINEAIKKLYYYGIDGKGKQTLLGIKTHKHFYKNGKELKWLKKRKNLSKKWVIKLIPEYAGAYSPKDGHITINAKYIGT